MAKALVEIALKENLKLYITAQTLPPENTLTAVLKIIGFEHIAEAEDQEVGLVWVWGIQNSLPSYQLLHTHSAQPDTVKGVDGSK